jgi:hypothetical protein
MKKSEVLNAWASILAGQKPSLSIEITRECPLRCPGCYAYEPEHLGSGGLTLRQLADYKGDDLVRRLLEIVDRERPVHLSLVGGDPPGSLPGAAGSSAPVGAARHSRTAGHQRLPPPAEGLD